MSYSSIAAMAGLALLGLLLLGMPIAFAFGLVGILGLSSAMPGPAWMTFTSGTALYDLTNFGFLAIPLFILMSAYITESGIGRGLIDAATTWLSALPGHLHSAAVLACGGFSAMSGSSIATAAAIGGVVLPEMKARGYSMRLGMGSIAAGGTLGMLIPPSNHFIIYGILTDTSISKLFIAGIVPGLIIIAAFITFNTLVFSVFPALTPADTGGKRTYGWADRWMSLRQTWTAMVLIVSVTGGIFFGIVTPTEAAAAGAFVALILATVVMRSMTLGQAHWAAVRAVHVTAMLGMIILGGLILGRAMTLLNVSGSIIEWIESSGMSPLMVTINALLLLLGLVMDAAAITLITVPLLYPLTVTLGFDPVWFGVIFCINLELGLITPPVGMNLFIIKGITGEKFVDIVIGVIPYALILAAVLILLIAFPGLVTWLPNYM